MKKFKFTTMAAFCILGLSSLASAGDLACQNKDGVKMHVLWGQGPQGADVTVVSSDVLGTLKFLSSYAAVTGADASKPALNYHGTLLNAKTGQPSGDVTLQGHQAQVKLVSGQSYALPCTEEAQATPVSVAGTCCHRIYLTP